MKKPKPTYRKLTFAELQSRLVKMEDQYGVEFPALENLFYQCRMMQQRMQQTLNSIAAYHDTEANEVLLKQGSYDAFDEPNATRLARETLQEM
jgi:hypothetical protein